MKFLCLALVMVLKLSAPVYSQTPAPAIDLPQWLLRASAEARASASPGTAELRRPYESLEGLSDEARANYLNWWNENMHFAQRLSGECWLFPKVFLRMNVYRAPGIYCDLDNEVEGQSLGVSAPKRNGVSVQPMPPKRGSQ